MFSTLDLLFSSIPFEGAEQMALDEVLLGVVECPLLRIYAWRAPCVTFGYFQKLELVKKLYPHHQLIRRWSGGGCVEHGEDFTFALMVPESEPIAQQRASLFYRKLHEAIVESLQRYGISARLANQEDQLSGESCFVAPCPCDVMLGAQKIVGGAQRRFKGRLLYQGSLHCKLTGYRLRGEGGVTGFAPQEQWQSEVENGKFFFISLAQQLSSEVNLIKEKEAWLEKAHLLSLQKYRSEEWQKKR